MRSLFGENRIANLLQLFRHKPTQSVTELAFRLNVSERTVRNDIKQLNQDFRGTAFIDGEQGKFRLRIFQWEDFQEICRKVVQEEDLFNSPRMRMDYAFGRLLRADSPVLTDELAFEMNIGRTTLVGDLKKLREDIAPYKLRIAGKTSQGMTLEGTEASIRQYVLEQCYDTVYRDYPLDREILEAMQEMFRQHPYEKRVQESFQAVATLTLDRFLTGHPLGKLPEDYYNLISHPAFSMAEHLFRKIARLLGTEIPLEEKLFTLLPIAGMRTPADITMVQGIAIGEDIRKLMESMLTRIKADMNITFYSSEVTEEFLFHLMFMVNRLRFGVRLENPLLEELQEKYPLAYKIAGVAAEEIKAVCGVEVTEPERGYLASYFGVFLEEYALQHSNEFRVAVICGTGRVTARLVAVQLKKILDSTARIDLFNEEAVSDELLKDYDIVFATVDLAYAGKYPVIRIHEIFDEAELRHRIEQAKYWRQIHVPLLDNNWFMLGGLLEESRFFLLDSSQSYEEALEAMVGSLMHTGQADKGFWERLCAREKKGTMVFGQEIAIPHSLQYASDKLVLALGVSNQPLKHREHNIRVIFLLGLPEKAEAEGNFLIRVYDEIISIAQDKELLDKVAGAKSLQDLLRVLYRQAGE